MERGRVGSREDRSGEDEDRQGRRKRCEKRKTLTKERKRKGTEKGGGCTPSARAKGKARIVGTGKTAKKSKRAVRMTCGKAGEREGINAKQRGAGKGSTRSAENSKQKSVKDGGVRRWGKMDSRTCPAERQPGLKDRWKKRGVKTKAPRESTLEVRETMRKVNRSKGGQIAANVQTE